MDKTLLILTSSVYPHNNIYHLYQKDYESRLKTYLSSFGKWILETTFKIIIVDNTNYPYNELTNICRDNLLILHYDYNNIELEFEHLFLKDCKEKGMHEMYSIYYALSHIPPSWNIEYFFKLTGRYFIPNFDKFVSNIPCDKNIFLQYASKKCELYGCTRLFIELLFAMPNDTEKQTILENIICNRTSNQSLRQHIYRFPKLDVVPVIKGSRNEIIFII